MSKYSLILVLLAALFGDIHSQTGNIISISPPNGTVVDFAETMPATFSCFVEDPELGEPISIEWVLNGLPYDDAQILEVGAGASFTFQSLDFRENITFTATNQNSDLGIVDAIELGCRPAPLGPPPNNVSFFATFTLILPPVILFDLALRQNFTLPEGGVATVCVDASNVDPSFPPPFPFTVNLEVLSRSTATAGIDYTGVPTSLVFTELNAETFATQCFNVSLLLDDDDSEDVEILDIRLGNTSDRSVAVNAFSSLERILILCNDNAVRVRGGVDGAQGRVEVCFSGDWGGVCSVAAWDDLDAQVVCRQLGFDGVPLAYQNNFGVFAPARFRVFLSDVQCNGNEEDLLSCPSSGLNVEIECPSGVSAGVDCDDRAEPLFDFERPGPTVLAEEGDSIEVCVQLVSGVVSSPMNITITQNRESQSELPNAGYPFDFTTSPSSFDLESSVIILVFSPGVTRQCALYVILDDLLLEGNEILALEIQTFVTPLPPLMITLVDTDSVPPVILFDLAFRRNFTLPEGGVATVCVDASNVDPSFPPPFPFTVNLEVLSRSTATAGIDYTDVPTSLVFTELNAETFATQCFNVSLLLDDDDSEDVEILDIRLGNTSDRSVAVNAFSSLERILIQCNDNAVRVRGGVDGAQGRVEVCFSGDWGGVCSVAAWDDLDAQVVCRQLGFDGVPLAYQNNFGVFAPSRFGVFLSDVQCNGNEEDLLSCPSSGLNVEIGCPSGVSAGVDCEDRAEPLFDFERPELTVLAEGDSIEVCVQLVSGVVSSPMNITIFQNRESQSDVRIAGYPFDFTTSPSSFDLESSVIILLFSPGDTRQCATYEILDDLLLEGNEILALEIQTFVTPLPPLMFTILDTDSVTCVNGSQVCINRAEVSVSCLDAMYVCNGFPFDCPDNSDEMNCPEICPVNMFTCRTEGTCLDFSQLCDGYPDCLGRVGDRIDILALDEVHESCTDGCTDGEVSLDLGLNQREGSLRVCMNDWYIPVSTQGLTVVEASVVCQQLGVGQVGAVFTVVSLYSVQLVAPTGVLATLTCPDSTSSISQCTLGTTTEGLQAAVICYDEAPCTDGEIRIMPRDPAVPNEGRVEMCYQRLWGVIIDRQWSNRDAAVVCREMGYPSQGAVPVCGAVYNNDPLPVVAENLECTGNESALRECSFLAGPLGHPFDYLNFQSSRDFGFGVVGVRCDNYLPDGCTELDVRLTYRDSTGQSGQFEICVDGVWRRTCGNFGSADAITACSQLFGSPLEGELFAQISPLPEVFSETVAEISDPLDCFEGRSNFSQCGIGTQTTEPTTTPPLISCTPADQPTVRCPARPVISLVPDIPSREYITEEGRLLNLQCAAEPNTLNAPLSVRWDVGDGGPGFTKREVKRSASPGLVQTLLDTPAAFFDSRAYSCVASNDLGISFENANVQVLAIDSESPLDTAFLQLSVVNSTRFQTIPNGISTDDFVFALQQFVLGLIYEATPGVQSVSCYDIDNRPVDVMRGLTRIECEIRHTPRADDTQSVTAAQIANRLVVSIPNTVPFVTDVTTRESFEVDFGVSRTTQFEGEMVTVCLNVVRGQVTTPTTVELSTAQILMVDDGDGGLFPSDEGSRLRQAFAGEDFNISVPFTGQGQFIFFTLTFQPGRTEECFDVDLIDNNALTSIEGIEDRGVAELGFYYSRSSPRVATSRRMISRIINIIDNDRNCTAESAPGSRLCVDTAALVTFCVEPDLVCNYVSVDCPDLSDELNCPSPIEDLVGQPVTNETLGNVSTMVAEFAALSENGTFLQTMDFLMDISMTFSSIADFVNSSNSTINQTVVQDLSRTLNSLIQWQQMNLTAATTSSIVQSFETVTTQFAQQANYTEEFSDITIVAELGQTSVFMQSGSMQDFSARAGVPAIINLPPELFNQVPADRPIIGVLFALYEEPALLPTSQSTGRPNVTTAVGTPIVAATVGPGIDFQNLDPPVTITFGLVQLPDGDTFGNPRCVSWDFATVSWITDGCTTSRVGNDTFVCSCTHLTNFAVLVDICSRAQDCQNNPDLDRALSFITIIGVVISCVGLVITIITLLIFKKLRERDNSKYHIQLSIAIFCMLIVFISGVENAIHVYAGCIIVSILIHYFTLVAVMWMGAEALLMFQKLVIVFTRITKKFLIILSLICWLVPLIPVLIPMIVDVATGTDPDSDLIINRQTDNVTGAITGGYCFHQHPGVFFGAFLAPILAVLLFNVVIFIWVIVILVRHTRGQLERSKERMKPKTALRLTVSISGIMFLFGITWLFAAGTFQIAGSDVVRIIFQVLFTIFASLQGFFIFLFFCVFNREARESWRELLSCGRYKSEFLHPSQYKPTSSGGTTPKTKIRTNTTGAASSTLGGTTYNSGTLDKSTYDSEASPLPEKRDISKEGEGRYTEMPLTSTNRVDEGVSTFKGAPEIVETKVDDEDDKEPNWSEAEPVVKARVKRYSTKKTSKHHIEEYEVDFENETDHSDEEPIV